MTFCARTDFAKVERRIPDHFSAFPRISHGYAHVASATQSIASATEAARMATSLFVARMRGLSVTGLPQIIIILIHTFIIGMGRVRVFPRLSWGV